MNTIERDIFRYAELSEAEQRAVEERVAGHPDHQALLREVKRLEAQLRRVQLPDAHATALNDLPDALLALYALHTVNQTRTSQSERLQQFFEDVEARLETDASLLERVQPMMDRARALDDAFDLAEHMQSVTGVDVKALPTQATTPLDPAADSVDDGDTPAQDPAQDGASPALRDGRSPAKPGPEGEGRHRISEQIWGAVRYVAVAAAVLMMAYGGLWAVSMATQSPAERMAALDPEETEIEGYQMRTRSATETELSSNDERFLQALQSLQEAHTAPLGLFPRFDTQRVQDAQQLLEQVVEDEENGSFLQLEASFFLAKTYLAQRDIEPARDALKRVVMGEGRRINEATQMLRTLQDEYPMDEPTLPEDVQL